VQIEKRYTKREILTLYAKSDAVRAMATYGVEAASHLYFGKSAEGLDARRSRDARGIIQSPAGQSPVRQHGCSQASPRLCIATDGRRGLRHAAAGRSGKQDSHSRLPASPNSRSPSRPFFLEEIRKYLERLYGAKALYESGLSVTTDA
jgi:penicillin-binding protein 1A